jgi:hypothetical protein
MLVIAWIIPAPGRVTVSLRRSMKLIEEIQLAVDDIAPGRPAIPEQAHEHRPGKAFKMGCG